MGTLAGPVPPVGRPVAVAAIAVYRADAQPRDAELAALLAQVRAGRSTVAYIDQRVASGAARSRR